jgi:hypothetical protein
MYATVPLPQVLPTPSRIPPLPPGGVRAPGAADPDDEAWNAFLEALGVRFEEGETADGCDWPDGPLSPNGCLW